MIFSVRDTTLNYYYIYKDYLCLYIKAPYLNQLFPRYFNASKYFQNIPFQMNDMLEYFIGLHVITNICHNQLFCIEKIM